MITTFGDLNIGDEFFDRLSGDYYIKDSDYSATLSGRYGDAWADECAPFQPTDEVEVE